MQIDALGNIVLPPTKIIETPKTHPGYVTALSLNGKKALNLWFISARFPFKISRIVVDKQTLRMKRFVETSLRCPDAFNSLTVTHRIDDNLISFPTETSDGIRVAVYPLNEFGHVQRPGWFLSPLLLPPACVNNCHGGVLSRRLGYWVTTNPTKSREADLYVQPLGPRGRPAGDPILLDRVLNHQSFGIATFHSADTTNILSGDRRLVAFIKTRVESEKGDELIVQSIDAKSANKIGKPIVLNRQEEFPGIAKIDPLGRFVLFFTTGDLDTPGGLTYQALDATGHPSGSPKILATNTSEDAMDLLPEKL